MKKPHDHNLLGKISLDRFPSTPSWVGLLITCCLSEINLAKRKPFSSFLSCSSSECGKLGKGGGLGDNDGMSDHTEEKCSFGWSRICSNEKSCISDRGKGNKVIISQQTQLKTTQSDVYFPFNK